MVCLSLEVLGLRLALPIMWAVGMKMYTPYLDMGTLVLQPSQKDTYMSIPLGPHDH